MHDDHSVRVKPRYHELRGVVTSFTNLKPSVWVVRAVNKLYIKECFHLTGSLQFFAFFTLTQISQPANPRP